MSQPKKKRTGRRAEKQQTPEVQVVYRNQLSRRTAVIISAIVLVLILVIIGIAYYPTYIAPYRVHLITIGDEPYVRMDYFLKRLKAAGSEPMSMLSTLAREEIVKLEADKYEIEITDEKIEHELRIIAAGSANATISDSEFKEWYRQRLNETGFSDSEYKEIIRTNVAASLIHQALAAAMPTTAEQIHLHVMLLESETLAYDIKGKLDAGEDFATLAREFSMDLNTRDDGGDIGWIPEGVADAQVEFFAWKLEAGGISEPFMVYDTSNPDEAKPVGYYIVWVSERAESREIDEQYIPTLQNNLLVDWFNEQVQIYDVKYHGLSGNGFDSETYTWINWQVTK